MEIADNGVVMSFLDIVEQDLSHNFRCFRRYINLYGKMFQNKNCNMLQIFMYDQHNDRVFCYMLHIPFAFLFKKNIDEKCIIFIKRFYQMMKGETITAK